MRASRVGSTVDRFWQRVERRGAGDCWNWQGRRHNSGYGVISGAINGKRYVPVGQGMLTHRVSWIIHHGDIPDSKGYHGAVVMHTCDNRLCVNPAHLRLGTQGENVADMHAKKRAVDAPTMLGPDHPNARFKDQRIVDWIRSCKIPSRILADAFRVDRHTITNIKSGRTYNAG